MNTANSRTPGAETTRSRDNRHRVPEGTTGRHFRIQTSGVGLVSLPTLRIAALFLFATGAINVTAALTPQQSRFFETDVRPLLADRCYQCHSTASGKIKGGLELDWKGGWEQGGDSGPAIKPGDPDHSLLIKAVRYGDPDLQMPPKGEKLTDAQIAVLEQWVKMGAPDPREQKTADPLAGGSKGDSDHWAFQPVTNPAPPAVKNSAWAKTDIDRFILAKLEAQGMKPNAEADKRTLIRRAYFDLIGLPPTVAEVDAFVADTSPDAWAKVIDRLLASPRYGERWGRHWLDVARYSDTKGQFNRNREESSYPYAWTYRDYVINAFNEDKPYHQFIMEQLAADRLPTAKDKNTLAALGFLTVGDRFNGMIHDVINDRIDVTTKAFLGLTVSCARCHDHMFDPIPTKDYYALHGIFNSSFEPDEPPVIARLGSVDEQNDYQARLLELELRRDQLAREIASESFGDYRKLSAVYLYALSLPEKERSDYVKQNAGDPALLGNWQRLVQFGARGQFPVFGPFNQMMRLPDERFAQVAPNNFRNLARSRQAKDIHPSVVKMLTTVQPKTKGELAAAYGNLIAGRDAAFNQTMQELVRESGLRVVRGRKQNEVRQNREQIAALELAHPGAPGRAMVLYDAAEPKDSPVFIRGEANNRGDVVPRRFLEILGGSDATPFANGSGRLELARAIADPRNPLSARVLVNRVWQHHFGTGFVPTPDDLGNQSEDPSHPELLDHLATRFMQQGWSLKQLHKDILLSATWRQSTETNEKFAELDPFNRLLWRANVRRLEFEPLRDSILFLGGKLDLTMGGKPVDLSEGTHVAQGRNASMLTRGGSNGIKLSDAHRRSVYGFVDRADVMEMMNVFDFASPDMPTGRRYETTVPQQALFLMNSPLVIEQAKNVVAREEFTSLTDDGQRVEFLYELIFQRMPTAKEIRLGREFVAGFAGAGERSTAVQPVNPPANVAGQAMNRRERNTGRGQPVSARKFLSGWAEYAHALLLTDETCFVN